MIEQYAYLSPPFHYGGHIGKMRAARSLCLTPCSLHKLKIYKEAPGATWGRNARRAAPVTDQEFATGAAAVLEEVRRLNVKILLYCIENVTSNVLQQIQYIKDINTLPTPIERPAYVDKPNNYTYDISNLL